MKKGVFKTFLAVTLAVSMLLATSACSSGGKTAGSSQSGSGTLESQNFNGVTLRFLSFNHIWTDTIKTMLPDFEKQTGAKVNMESYVEDPLTQKLTVEFSSGASTVDVFITRPLQEGRLFNKNGWYESLDSYINSPTKTASDYDWKDFLPSYVKTCTNSSGKVFCVPITSDLQMMIYRKDWFQEKNIKVPTNYTELEAACKAFTDTSKGTYGLAMRGQRSYAVTQFATFLYGFGGTFLKDGKCALDSDASIKAFQFYGKLLHNYAPPGTTNMSWPQTEAVFGSGKVAMLIESNAPVPDLLNKDKFNIYDKIGFTTIPAGPAGCHPYATVPEGLAVYSHSKNKDAAWALIQYLTNKSSMKTTSSKGITQGRKSIINDPSVTSNLPSDYVATITKTAAIGEPADRPLMTSVTEARDAIGEVIVQAIDSGGTADFKSLTKTCVQKVNDLLKKDGEYGTK